MSRIALERGEKSGYSDFLLRRDTRDIQARVRAPATFRVYPVYGRGVKPATLGGISEHLLLLWQTP